MDSRDVLVVLEQASEALVLAGPGDLPALADLHTKLEHLHAAAEGMAPGEVGRAARACADLVERMVLDELRDPARALEAVGDTLGALQSTVRDGRPPEGLAILEFRDGDPAPPIPTPAEGSGPEPPVLRMDATEPESEVQAEDLSPAPLEGDPSLMAEFVAEAREHLDAADVHLLTLETDPRNEEALNAVFRAFHTLKGVAGFLGLEDVQRVAHESENLLDRARKGVLELRGAAIDATFDAVDLLKRLIRHVEDALASGGLLARESGISDLIRRLQALATGIPGSAEPPVLTPTAEAGRLGEILIEQGVATPEAVGDALRQQLYPPEHKKLGDLLVESASASRVAVEEALALQAQDPDRGRVGDILVELGHARRSDVDDCLARQAAPEPPRLGELLVRQGVPAREVAQALRSQQDVGRTVVRESVKVDADRLDRLVDLIGELVIAESMVSQSPELQAHAGNELLRHIGRLDKITRELQEMGTSLRMVPVRSTFQKMARLARDVARKSGRQIEFITFGDETELDKSVVDKIGDPLVHMVRNAVDHGLEATVEERRAAGKPDAGRVELRAYHEGGDIFIEIRDDGRGLDRDAIRAKAVERGLIDEEDALADREVWDLIFQPGFSTARTVTDVSGRGVGMDVVRRNIEALRGRIEVHSERGRGTTFSIRLPLTLAIIDGMVIGVGDERYVIPTLSIVRSIRPRAEDISRIGGRGEVLILQGRLLPIFRLSRLFGIPALHDDLTEGVVVVAESDRRRVGLAVDRLLGQQQIVIKSLGESVQRTPGIAGGAIMPDGSVGLILDVAGLMRLAESIPWDDTGGPKPVQGDETCKRTA